MEYLAAFEQTGLSIWVREEWWVFPLILVFHSLGMGLMAGVGAASGLRALGFAPALPTQLLQRFFPLVWLGFVVNLLSGLLLLAGYPAKGLTNPLFYLKMVFLGGAMYLTLRLLPRKAVSAHVRSLAWMSLALWAAVIGSGRFLAYTHSVLLASWL